MSPNLIMVLSIIISLLMLVLSVLIGYNLYKGGKEINNDKISKAGLYWLIIIAVFLIISIVSYVSMSNALKEISPEKVLVSSEAIRQGEYALLNEQNWSAAISGDSVGNSGLKSVAESYNGDSGGDIAQYELGIAYLNNGEYQEAITALEQVAFEDEMIASITFGAIGDAYIELGNITSAAEYYEKAYTNSKNDLTAPIYMLKAAYAKETENKYEDAVKIYKELINKYPLVPEVNEAKKYIELAKKEKSIYNL